ncbi:MAG: hypothetical protein GX410_03460 [Elusimicrobia bacterium]|nr:hypothetical protein [Elusimicrobiota bacterium]
MTDAAPCTRLSRNFTVRSYEQDLGGRLRPAEVFNWFQETASAQCRINRVAIEDILPLGYTWVIHRYKIAAAKMPVYEQECRVTTWAQPKRDLISIRDFALDSLAGERLVSATSEWALIDLKSGRPARLSAVMPEFPACAERALDENLRPIQTPENAAALKTTEAAATAWALDKNRHVNNSVYVFWACDNLYPELTDGLRLKEMEINYKKQAFFGQKIECRAFGCGGGTYYQSIALKDTGETLALVKSVWEKDA